MNRYILCLIIWFLLSVLAGYLELLKFVKPPLPQVIIFSLATLLILCFISFKGFKKWVLSLSLNILISIHLVRFVGFYFLYLYSYGRLPYSFAVYGGIGDIVIAVFTAYLLTRSKSGIKNKRYLITSWNTLGLIDIVFVVAIAARLMLSEPGSMAELTSLPLSMLVAFVVPLIIFTHTVIFYNIYIEKRKTIYE